MTLIAGRLIFTMIFLLLYRIEQLVLSVDYLYQTSVVKNSTISMKFVQTSKRKCYQFQPAMLTAVTLTISVSKHIQSYLKV
jgi:hypothetical protein